MKFKALRIPRQTDEVQHPPGPALLIRNEAFVRNLEQPVGRQHFAPMPGDSGVLQVIVGEVVQIVA